MKTDIPLPRVPSSIAKIFTSTGFVFLHFLFVTGVEGGELWPVGKVGEHTADVNPHYWHSRAALVPPFVPV
jgi:hypothetical protein